MKRIKQILHITNTLFKEDKKLIAWAIFLTLITTISSRLIIPFSMQNVFNAIEAGNQGYLYVVCGAVIFCTIVLTLLSFIFYVYADAWFVTIANQGISVMTHNLYDLPYKTVSDSFTEGELINRIEDGGIASTHIYNVGSRLAATLVSVFALMIASFFISEWAALFIVIITVCDVLRFRYEMVKRTQIIGRLKNAESRLEQTVYNAVENISFHMMNDSLKHVKRSFEEEREEYWIANKQLVFLKNILDFLSGSYYAVCRALLSYILLPSPSSNIVTAFSIFDSYKANIQECKEHMLRFPLFFKSIDRMNEIFEKIPKVPRASISDKDTLIKAVDLSFGYDERTVINNASFSISKNEKLALIGANGSGKSTLLRLILGLYEPKAGNVYIRGINSSSMINSERRGLVSYIPISTQLFSESIYRNVEMGSDGELSQEAALSLLKQCSLEIDKVNLTEKTATAMSGGESARVNMARGIASLPQIVIADELLAPLDKANREAVLNYLLNLDCALLMTIHNSEYLHLFDKVIDMSAFKKNV